MTKWGTKRKKICTRKLLVAGCCTTSVNRCRTLTRCHETSRLLGWIVAIALCIFSEFVLDHVTKTETPTWFFKVKVTRYRSPQFKGIYFQSVQNTNEGQVDALASENASTDDECNSFRKRGKTTRQHVQKATPPAGASVFSNYGNTTSLQEHSLGKSKERDLRKRE